MRLRKPRDARGLLSLAVVFATVAILSTSTGSLARTTSENSGPVPQVPGGAPATADLSLEALAAAPLAPVPVASADRVVPGSQLLSPVPHASMNVLLTFAYTNQSRLARLLANLSDPGSPQYQRYLTASEFDAEFAPPDATYRATAEYLSSFGVSNLSLLPDRAAITFSAPAPVVAAVFHDPLREYRANGSTYIAPSATAQLPAPLAAAVVSVDGLGTAEDLRADATTGDRVGAGATSDSAAATPALVDGFLAPVTVKGAQLEYAPDLQVAYDEQSLFATSGYPTNSTVATILWSGNYTGASTTTNCGAISTGTPVGPWVPSDIDDFFNATLPSGEPHASTYAVPIDGAPDPGCFASWDSTGATVQNTIDLETIGSTAPGASIYTVYGPNDSLVNLVTAFGEILSPPASLGAATVAGLENVSVVSNAWSLADENDTAWFADLEQAQARGISVLAESGNSSDSIGSSYYVGTNAEFPASMAYKSYGDVAVGGATLTLSATTLRIAREIAWSASAKYGGPAGSSGGISTVISEPAWQLDTSANRLLSGNGRGDPDLAAIANNTLLTITVDGKQYVATNASDGEPYRNASGTGVAVSVVAGLVAEIDHAMTADGGHALGFFDPSLYYWANREDAAQTCGTSVQGMTCTGPYSSPLPVLPTYDIVNGSNAKYSAGPGWDLVTGWGSLDAYNYTVLALNVSSDGVYGHLDGLQDRVDLTGLAVSSTLPTSEGGGTNTAYNASFQQNFFLADSLGAPIYWVQNVVYLHRTTSGWAMNFTGWVSFPFWGIYPNVTVSEWSFPAKGLIETLPAYLNLTTVYVPGTATTDPLVQFSFGVKDTSTLTLPVPGASFIIGTRPWLYNWQGVNYTDGPKDGGSPPGLLSPQFALTAPPGVGGSTGGGTASFASATEGTVAAYVEPAGSTAFEFADTSPVTSANQQTVENASNLSYTFVSYGTWSFGYKSGSETQGISQVQPVRYTVSWTETGALPAGTSWYVNLTTGEKLVAEPGNASVSTLLQNGSYDWSVGVGARGWASSPPNGTVKVDGGPTSVNLTMALAYGNVTFTAEGPSFPFSWYANVTGEPSLHATGTNATENLTYGSYTYKVASENKSWAPTVRTSSFVIGAKPAAVLVEFLPVTYALVIEASAGPGLYPTWTVTVGTFQQTNVITVAFTFDLTNGTYDWSVSKLTSGFTASPSSGTVKIHGTVGHPIVVDISQPASGLFGLGVWGYVLVGGLAAAGAAAVVFVVRRRRRRTPPEPPQRPERYERPPRPRRSGHRGYVDPDEL